MKMVPILCLFLCFAATPSLGYADHISDCFEIQDAIRDALDEMANIRDALEDLLDAPDAESMEYLLNEFEMLDAFVQEAIEHAHHNCPIP